MTTKALLVGMGIQKQKKRIEMLLKTFSILFFALKINRLVDIWSAARKRYGGGWHFLYYSAFLSSGAVNKRVLSPYWDPSRGPFTASSGQHYTSSLLTLAACHTDSQGSKKPFRTANRIYSYGSSLNWLYLGWKQKSGSPKWVWFRAN